MTSSWKTLVKVLGLGVLVGVLVTTVMLFCSRSCQPKQSAAPATSPEPQIVATSTATASTAVAQTVTVRLVKPKRVTKPKADHVQQSVEEDEQEELVVEVTQQATASAVAAATSSIAEPQVPAFREPKAFESDLTDPTRWGIGVGMVAGTVFVDYQLIRQRVLNQEFSLDLQANHVQAGAGLAVTLTDPVFIEVGLSLPYVNPAQPVPYWGAGARLRF